MSVTLMFIPAAIDSSMAGSPSSVAGILIITLGRATRSKSVRASRHVVLVSCAIAGDTSTDTKPSAPPVASCTGRSRSAAAMMSSRTIVQYVASIDASSRAHCTSCSS